MNFFIKKMAVVLATLSLTACMEVEDNNDNSELTAAIQKQNDILTEQNNLLQIEDDNSELVSVIQQQNDILTEQNNLLQIEDDNSELVSVIQQQNDILTEQNNVLNAQHSVTLTGNIKNISINTLAKNASVAIKVGNNWSEPVNLAEDGSFKINNLPFNSDFTLCKKQ
jgi:hypothetical protein